MIMCFVFCITHNVVFVRSQPCRPNKSGIFVYFLVKFIEKTMVLFGQCVYLANLNAVRIVSIYIPSTPSGLWGGNTLFDATFVCCLHAALNLKGSSF